MRKMSFSIVGIFMIVFLIVVFNIKLNKSETVSNENGGLKEVQHDISKEVVTKEKEVNNDPYQKYDNLNLIDVHNHDATASSYKYSMEKWKYYHVHKIVLFGNVSEPSALVTDRISWNAYENNPDLFYPFFAGVDLHSQEGLAYAKKKLEQGYYGIGEIYAASENRADLEWEGKDPMDGIFPELYKLCAQYKVPILLHIDPPFGRPINKLEEALDKFPNTKIIFGHANAYNSPKSIETLLKKHPNLYIDFFAGFTAYNPDSTYKIKDFVPVIEEFPNRVFLSTDSAYAMNYDQAYQAIYQTIDLLDPSTAKKVASKNFESIMEAEPATQTQIKTLKELANKNNTTIHYNQLNKIQANEWIIKLR